MTQLTVYAKNEDGSMMIFVMEEADATIAKAEDIDVFEAKGKVVSFESYFSQRWDHLSEQANGASAPVLDDTDVAKGS